MPIIDVDLGGYVEPQVVTELDKVYTLKIRTHEEKEGVGQKSSDPYHTLDLLCAITDSELENPKMVRKTLFLPVNGDDFDRRNAKIGQIRRLQKAIGDVDPSGEPNQSLDPDAWANCEFKAKLGLKHDEQYGDSNTVKRIVVQ